MARFSCSLSHLTLRGAVERTADKIQLLTAQCPSFSIPVTFQACRAQVTRGDRWCFYVEGEGERREDRERGERERRKRERKERERERERERDR